LQTGDMLWSVTCTSCTLGAGWSKQGIACALLWRNPSALTQRARIRRLQHQPGAGVQRVAAVLDASLWRRVCCRQPAVRICPLAVLCPLDAVPASC